MEFDDVRVRDLPQKFDLFHQRLRLLHAKLGFLDDFHSYHLLVVQVVHSFYKLPGNNLYTPPLPTIVL